MTPVRSKVRFALTPEIQSAEVTPYAHVYGVHPALFDFDRHGAMQPTPAGMVELQRGALQALTPSVRGKMAFVIQGSSPCSSSGVPSPTRFWASTSPVHTQSPRPDQQYAIGEQILVLTDDGKAWMDGLVVACYSRDCEAEGYSIPGGTVKVSYDLGIKWIMPQNITTTLRKKTPTSFPGFGVPPRHGITNVPQTQQPYSKQEVQQSPVSPAVTRHVFHGGMPMLLGRGA